MATCAACSGSVADSTAPFVLTAFQGLGEVPVSYILCGPTCVRDMGIDLREQVTA